MKHGNGKHCLQSSGSLLHLQTEKVFLGEKYSTRIFKFWFFDISCFKQRIMRMNKYESLREIETM